MILRARTPLEELEGSKPEEPVASKELDADEPKPGVDEVLAEPEPEADAVDLLEDSADA